MHGHPAFERCAQRRRMRLLDEVGGDGTRADGVGTDAVRRQIDGELARRAAPEAIVMRAPPCPAAIM
jgi:hypothetical protein